MPPHIPAMFQTSPSARTEASRQRDPRTGADRDQTAALAAYADGVDDDGGFSDMDEIDYVFDGAAGDDNAAGILGGSLGVDALDEAHASFEGADSGDAAGCGKSNGGVPGTPLEPRLEELWVRAAEEHNARLAAFAGADLPLAAIAGEIRAFAGAFAMRTCDSRRARGGEAAADATVVLAVWNGSRANGTVSNVAHSSGGG
jgi:hypothetical protein